MFAFQWGVGGSLLVANTSSTLDLTPPPPIGIYKHQVCYILSKSYTLQTSPDLWL